MLTERDVSLIDYSHIYPIYEKWPEHFAKASSMRMQTDHSPEFYRSVVLCGMGGSATSCDILGDLLHHYSNMPFAIVRGQNLPTFADKHSLVMIKSVSGNTEESLSMAEMAVKRNCEVICISAGGKLQDFAKKNGCKHVNIPSLSLPRASLPYLIMPSLNIIDSFLTRSLKDEVSSIPASLSKIAKEIDVSVPYETNIAKQMAAFLHGGFVFCFMSPYLSSVGTRFKNSLNENAKLHCLKESILEASHNEIVPFTYKNFGLAPKALLLRWAGDPAMIKERFKKVNSLFEQTQTPVMEMQAFESGLTSAIISSMYILDFATIYLAISSGIDPSPTPAIDILKKMS